ncbi:MAG: ATP synthase subunit C [Gammaproteobacteria bacterium]|nr:ATP synthase subunit C [Gammaproteobacteria bacterium]
MKIINAKLTFWLGSAALMSAIATLLLWWSPAMASDVAESKNILAPEVLQWGFLAAALSTGLSSLGAAYAVATVGSAAVAALTEKPELLGRVLIVIGLAEGIAIYGLIVSILILNAIV